LVLLLDDADVGLIKTRAEGLQWTDRGCLHVWFCIPVVATDLVKIRLKIIKFTRIPHTAQCQTMQRSHRMRQPPNIRSAASIGVSIDIDVIYSTNHLTPPSSALSTPSPANTPTSRTKYRSCTFTPNVTHVPTFTRGSSRNVISVRL
jgi:hypothetical protein